MKYLKSYISFNEEAEFDPQVTDAPDLKMSKEKLNTVINQVKSFKSKKKLIDDIYLKKDSNGVFVFNDEQLKVKLKELLGPETSPKGNRNPFLVEYLNVSDLKRRLDKVRTDMLNDKLKLDDFNQELKAATDPTSKSSISQKIDDINKRTSLSNTTISKLTSDISNAEKSLNLKMSKIEKDMKDYIKNIKNTKTQ